MTIPWRTVLVTALVVAVGAATIVGWIRFIQTSGVPVTRGRVGVQLYDGDIFVRVQTCSQEQVVERAQLVGPDDAVLWDVEARRSTSLRSFTVGRPHEALEETIHLAPSIDRSKQHLIRVWLSESEGLAVNEFLPDTLDDNLWDVTAGPSAGDRLTDVEFLNLDAC